MRLRRSSFICGSCSAATKLVWSVCFAATAISATSAFPQTSACQSVNTLCVVRALDEVEVPSRRDGLIDQLLVRRGSTVTEGQLLATLDVTDKRLQLKVAEAQLQQAQTKSENEGLVKSSEAAVDRARLESKLMRELGADAVYLEKFRMENSLEKALAELQSTENQLDQDRLQVDIERHELKVLENDIEQTRTTSPVSGIVRETTRDQGEWVRQGEPILTVTRLDRLLAEGFVDSSVVPVHAVIGATATVTFRYNDQDEPTIISGLIVDRSSPNLELDGKYPVWVEFDNITVPVHPEGEHWLIRPGMRGSLSIELPASNKRAADPLVPRTASVGIQR